MNKTTYATYRRVCEARYEQAQSVKSQAEVQVELAERRLGTSRELLKAFDEHTARMVAAGVSAAQWILIENRRQLLADDVLRHRREVTEQRRVLALAEATREAARATQRTAERVGDRLASEERRFDAVLEQSHLDDLANARVVRTS